MVALKLIEASSPEASVAWAWPVELAEVQLDTVKAASERPANKRARDDTACDAEGNNRRFSH